ncbi:class I SAM-dependent methyltransferase [Chloroflexota bacterium]
MSLTAIDWLELWRGLTLALGNGETWVERYICHLHSRPSERPDPLMDFVLDDITPQDTAMDVGVGSGRWSIPQARKARQVTAVEPSETMLAIFCQNVAVANLSNIEVVLVSWEETSVKPHDVDTCANAIYSSPDFAGFVRKTEQYAWKRCYLAIRLPLVYGIISGLSLAIYGHRYDSPNAVIAYDAF